MFSFRNPQEETYGKDRFNSARILVLMILLSFIIRVIYVVFFSSITNDEMYYMRMAQNLNSGNGLTDIYGSPATVFFPLLPVLIAVVQHVLQNYIISGYFVAIFFGGLTLLPVYLLGRELMGERVGLLAAALAMIYPVLIMFSSHIITEVIYAFFLLMAVFFVWQMLKQPRLVYGGIAGGLLGLAYLTNPGAISYLVISFCLAAGVALKRGVWRRMAGSMGLLLLIFTLLAMPYFLFLHAHLGKWTYSGKNAAANIGAAASDMELYSVEWKKKYMTLTEDGQDVVVNQIMNENPDPLSDLIGNPVARLKIFASNANSFYSDKLNHLFPVWLFSLLGLGLFAQRWDRKTLTRIGFILLMIVPALFVLTIDTQVRLFVPFVVFSLLLVAKGWQRFEQWAMETAAIILPGRNKVRLRIIPWLVGAIVLLPLLPFSVAKAKQDFSEFREAGELIQRMAGPQKRIMNSRTVMPVFYADGTAVQLPWANYEQTTNYAKLKMVDYLVIRTDDISDEGYASRLTPLLEDESKHPDWKLVERMRPGTKKETLIFELQK